MSREGKVRLEKEQSGRKKYNAPQSGDNEGRRSLTSLLFPGSISRSCPLRQSLRLLLDLFSIVSKRQGAFLF